MSRATASVYVFRSIVVILAILLWGLCLLNVLFPIIRNVV